MAYAFVQTKSASGSGVTSVTTPAFSSNTTVGNQLIASTSAAVFPSIGFTSTVTDSKSNTWRNDANVNFTNSFVHGLANIDQTILTTAGSGHTVTFTSNDAGNTYYEVACTEFSGATSTIDQTASNTALASSTSITATTSATTNANDLLICVFASNGTNPANGQNSPANVNSSQTGVNSIVNINDDSDITGIESSYKILSSTGTQAVNYTYTTDTGGGYGLAVVVYQAAGSAAVDNTTARSIASPGLKLGTPISRLRSPILDTGTAPPPPINQTVGVSSRALRLGTPVSRLRSSNLFDDRSTPAPPVVPVDAGAKPGWAVALKLGTPISVLRAVYDDGTSTSIAQGTGVAIASSVAIGAPSDTPALAGVAVSSGVGVAQEGALAAEAGISVSSTVAVAAPSDAAALAAISVSSSVGVAGPSGAAALSGIAVSSTLGVGAPADTSALAGIAVSSSVGIANLTTIGSAAGSGIAVSSSVALAAPSDAPAMAGVSVSSGLAIAQIIASGSISGISVSSSVGVGDLEQLLPPDTTTPAPPAPNNLLPGLVGSESELGQGMGPYRRPGQVFGEPDPVSPYLTGRFEDMPLAPVIRPDEPAIEAPQVTRTAGNDMLIALLLLSSEV
jgi:hypothetical protein